MKILSDLHHSGLYYSLQLLLEKRLGHSLYRPIGMDWFERGFWNIAEPYGNNIDTVKQYLSLQPGYQPVDGTTPLNDITHRTFNSKHYRIRDNYHETEQQAITFTQFLDMDIDVIIASIPRHWTTYTQLRDQFKPRAKVIYQMGNMFAEIADVKESRVNLMASTIPFSVPSNWNTVFYYQEQPPIEFTPSPTRETITSFVHLLPRIDLYDQYRAALPNFSFYAYGAGAPNGYMATLPLLYQKMRTTAFVWQVKPGGDGYGWNFHTAFASGRPVITNFSDYKDKLGGVLFQDGINGIDLEKRTFVENCLLLHEIANSDRLLSMQNAAYSSFQQHVSYEREGEKVKAFLDHLI